MTTKIKMAITISALALIGIAIAVKLIFFPAISDKYFSLNQSALRRVPAGLAVVRPTHFKGQNGVVYVNVKGNTWMMGRNVTFQTLVANAYSHNPARIFIPADASKKNFDFLVTVPKNPQTQLQAAIRRKVGYTAQVETRDTDVMMLKVDNSNSSGLKISTAKNGNEEVKNGRLYITHAHISEIVGGLEQIVKMPVIDKTGLTNFYDFSLAWNPQIARQMQDGTMDSETGKKILAEWGLGIYPDTASVEMLVVKKAK